MLIEYVNRFWKLIVLDCFIVGNVVEVLIVQIVVLLGLFDFIGMFNYFFIFEV